MCNLLKPLAYAAIRCHPPPLAYILHIHKRARELAQQAPLGQVRVKNQKGRIQFEWTYGDDPRKYPS